MFIQNTNSSSGYCNRCCAEFTSVYTYFTHKCNGLSQDLKNENDYPWVTLNMVNKPSHYNRLPNIECMDVVKWFNFCKGNAIKYIWRSGHKGGSKADEIADLKKAIKNLEFEIKRLEKE